MKRQGRAGFTLIELLVVIAVIAILAAILFPVFAKVREKGRQTACLSNVRQIAAGLMMYVEDYDELFPPALSLNAGETFYYQFSWMNRLQPYVRNVGLFVCPSSNHRNTDWRSNGDMLQNYGYTPSLRVASNNSDSVLLETAFGNARWEGLGGFYGSQPLGLYARAASSHSVAEVARPSETVAVTDHLDFDWGFYKSAFKYPQPRHIVDQPFVTANGVPSGLMNVVFCDGHAKAMRHERLFEIRRDFTQRYGKPSDVFIHFWPYD